MKIKNLTLATHNAHKLQEFQDYLTPLGILVHGQNEFVDHLEVEETGKTYEENAYLKAKAVLPYSPYPVLADDSGIEIQALGPSFPGIYSARYLESLDANSLKADQKILEKLQNEQNRDAAFHCVLVLLSKDEKKVFEGVCEGSILPAIKGEKGFGYDPIFHSKEGNINFGECDEATKSKYSHRGKAIEKLLEYLKG